MKNADMPAMPTKLEIADLGFVGVSNATDAIKFNSGLTKREMFAMHAMQGILSNSGGVIQGNNYSGTGWCNSNAQDLAKWSIECADAMLAELDK